MNPVQATQKPTFATSQHVYDIGSLSSFAADAPRKVLGRGPERPHSSDCPF